MDSPTGLKESCELPLAEPRTGPAAGVVTGDEPRRRRLLVLILIQLSLSVLFLSELVTYYVIGYDNIPWELVELYELSEAVITIASVGIGVSMVVLLTRRNDHVEAQLKAASGAFHELMLTRFREWELSPSEAEVALFTIKGMSNGEIARLRGTSEGTIKAQSNAVFRKAGVNGRTQLLGIFMEEFVSGAKLDTNGA
ncbi:MAG: helix-turn-helix transcriptional regulator [Nitratireductor sp.]|nr:helix-turn-helix transcriptional regulator [Nitratireductor sp.]